MEIQAIADSLNIRTHVDERGSFWFCTKDLQISSNIRVALQKLPKHGLLRHQIGARVYNFVNFDCLKLLICRSRDTRATDIAKKFEINVTNTKLLNIETETLDIIMKCFHGIEMVPQYAINGYRIDLYFPKHRLAVECDEEYSHSKHHQLSDYARQIDIEKELGCSFIRYRPQNPTFCVAKLINTVLMTLMSCGSLNFAK